jgi:hypothetical protein
MVQGGGPRRHLRAKVEVSSRHLRRRPWDMASTIGLDIAKRVFQVHGSDASGHVVLSDFAPGRIPALKVVRTAHAACITLSAMRALWRKRGTRLRRREAETYRL